MGGFRYFGTHLLIFATIVGLLAGGAWCWLGFVTGVVVWVGADALSGPVRDRPVPEPHAGLLDFALYSLFPSLVAMSVVFAWGLSSGDLLGIGAWLEANTGRDAIAVREAQGLADYLGASWSFALAVAMGGILPAHELTHRTRDPLAMATGRWMLAMAFNATLEVAHVFGHHREVATPADPATARRGENVYRFYVRSSVGQVAQAWRIERAHLQGIPWPRRIFLNRVIRGFLRSYFVAGLFLAAGGWLALGVFLLSAVWNKFLLESLNYMEHYGLVRVPGAPIEARHAWDSDRSFSHATLFHLPWHADHHQRVGAHYPELRSAGGSLTLPHGYLASLPVVWIPWWWNKTIAPCVEEWDRSCASDKERNLLVRS
jgi:alkane 1-monooxygenase